MKTKSTKKSVVIPFNKLRARLPHRYRAAIAEKLENITPNQVKLVFTGELKNPEIVEKVYEEALKLAEKHKATSKLQRKTAPRKAA